MFLTAGGGNLLLVSLGSSVVARLDAVHLVIDIVALALFVHYQDVFLPLIVGGQNTDSDVGDEGGIACRDPLS